MAQENVGRANESETGNIIDEIRYALGQLRRTQASGLRDVTEDCVQRAIDALERAEAQLKAPMSRDEETE